MNSTPRAFSGRAQLWALAASQLFPGALTAQEQELDFDRDVRPILAAHCFDCHGPDGAARKADLRLDQHAGALTVARPSDLQGSELWRRVTHSDAAERMPPEDFERPLSDDQRAILRAWIEGGLDWSEHWAFVTPQRHTPPTSESAWPRSDLDRLVLARLEAEGLAPSREASREQWLRRVSFDLIGLPPTPEELDAFLSDSHSGAHERVVDRLLANEAYGERMATSWLDGARYADTNGYQNDFGRDQWPWRDWVIEQFNQNVPFDRFALEQIAGDLLPDASLSQVVATGFQRNHRMVTEGGSIEEEWLVENVVDRVETTSTVFLGLTLGCARCHDHKYDPVSQEEFYSFFAFFHSIDEKGFNNEARGNVEPLVSLPNAEHEARLGELETHIAAAQERLSREDERLANEHHEWIRTLSHAARPEPLPEPTFHHVLDGIPQLLDPPSVVSLAGEQASNVDLGQAAQFFREQPFSLTLWVAPEGHGAVFSKMDASSTYRGVDLLLLEDRRLAVHVIHDWPRDAIKVITRASLPKGRWTHLAAVYDGSSKAQGLHVYLDGHLCDVEVEVDALSGELATTEPVRFGKRHYAAPFHGRLADFAIHDVALSETQIRGAIQRHARLLASRLRSGLPTDGEGQLLDALQHLQRSAFDAERHAAARELEETQRKKREFESAGLPTVMVLRERAEPRPTFVLKRGRYDLPDETRPVQASVPGVLHEWPAQAARNRLGLAQWIVDPANPLTARVTVNRIWQRLFGIGLVETSEDFGIQGARPSHPQLLDWLALDFVEDGWDLKALQRRIVLSSTYRQTSDATPQAYARDPDNRLLARGPRFRLPAEFVRDNALAISGLLVHRIGGPPTRPYQPAGLWTELAGGAGQGPYVQDEGEGLFRKSLYIHRKRTVPHPTLSTFDAPAWELCSVRRESTNTPLQALALMNDTTYVEAARALAQRMHRAAANPVEQLRHGFRLATSRWPSGEELTLFERGYRERRAHFARAPDQAQALLAVGATGLAPPDCTPELAALTLSASVLLNLDETLTKP